MLQFSSSNSVMETRDHSKNGASLKSQKSKVNFFNKVCFAILIAVFSLTFVACDKDDGSEKIHSDNLFAGTWVQDYSDGDVVVVFTETKWTSKYKSSTYNSGTYTYEGNTAQLTVTNKGTGSANVGNTGTATISNNKMTISGFSDENMNDRYTKR